MRPDRGPGGFETRGAAASPALPWPRYGRGLDALGELHREYRQRDRDFTLLIFCGVLFAGPVGV